MDEKPTNLFRRFLLFFSLASIGCAADLFSKYKVFEHAELYRGSEWWLWNGHIGIQKSLNEGALFGMGQGAVFFFALVSIAAAIGIVVWLYLYGGAKDFWLNVIMGCIMGGVLGNLYDRLGLHGLQWDQFDLSRSGERVYAVRDWILLQWDPQWVWPNFNIADALLVVGTMMLIVRFWSVPEEALETPSRP